MCFCARACVWMCRRDSESSQCSSMRRGLQDNIELIELGRNCSKFNVLCVVMADLVRGPFLCNKSTIAAMLYIYNFARIILHPLCADIKDVQVF